MIVICIANTCNIWLIFKIIFFILIFFSEYYLSILIKFDITENVIDEWRKLTPYVN